MQQHLSVKRREWKKVASWKLEENPEGAMQQRQTQEWIWWKEYQGCQHSQCAFSEFYVAQYPVNQWIVVGEPAMSKYKHTGGIQWSDKECLGGDFASGEFDVEFDGFSDKGVR